MENYFIKRESLSNEKDFYSESLLKLEIVKIIKSNILISQLTNI